MMSRMLLKLSLSLVFTKLFSGITAYTFRSCAEAAIFCNFRFQSNRMVYDVTDTSDNGPGFTEVIVSEDGWSVGEIAIVLEWTSTYLADYGNFAHITDLNEDLVDSQFKPFNEDGELRIGHETFQGDSRQSVQGHCIRVDFLTWQITDIHGNEERVSNSPSSASCIVFELEPICESTPENTPIPLRALI